MSDYDIALTAFVSGVLFSLWVYIGVAMWKGKR
jgi:hypothetical protein